MAQAHDGSLGAAHAYIEAIAAAGADAVKFQTHIAAAESTPAEPFRVKFSRQDATRYEYWKRMEFTPEQWSGLACHATERGLIFLSSPFSEAAVDLLEKLGVPAWKVGSGEIGTRFMLEKMARTGKPVLLSTGLAGWRDLDRAAGWVRACGSPVGIYQCTTAYPCPPEKWGFNLLPALRERYQCPVGLSDHSGGIYAGLAAATLGVDMLEVHVTFSRECFGPDVPASVTTAELRQLVAGVRQIQTALSHPVDKDNLAAEMADLRQTFGKSIVAARSLPAGHCLASEDLAFKKPGTGIPPTDVGRVLGRRLLRDVPSDHLFRESDFDS